MVHMMTPAAMDDILNFDNTRISEEQMKKRITTIVLVLLILFTMLASFGCNGRMNMLMGRWKLATAGDENGGNQQQYPLPVIIDIYPDHTIDMLDSPFGTWTLDRDIFTFKSDDGTINTSGSYTLTYPQDQSTGNTVPTLTIFMDDQPVTYVLQKQADLGPLMSYKRSQTTAPAAPPATATPAPATATATATSAQ